MALTWRRIKPLKSENALADFENRYGFSIGNELKDFIINHNGGRPIPKTMITDNGEEYEVKCFLSFNPDDTDSVYKVIDFFTDNYSNSLLPFAKDSADNYFCLKDGKIILWFQDMTDTPICDSFSKFLELLAQQTTDR